MANKKQSRQENTEQVEQPEQIQESVADKIQRTLDELKDSLLITDSRIGEFLVYKNDAIISKAIDMFGEYCHAEIDIIKTYITEVPEMQEMAVYVDVGTNIGYHAVGVHKVTGCNVIGMEPNPKHFAVASYNSKDYGKVQIINAGASATDGEFKMKDFDPNNEGNYGDIHKSDSGELTIKTIAIDNLNLNRATVMKYDVEGHEYEALLGSEKTISKNRPVIMYEAMEWDVWNKCYDFLDERKYKQYWVACKTKPVRPTHKPSEENPFGASTVANILAIPAERKQPDYLVEVVPGEPFGTCFRRYQKMQIIF